LYEARPESFDDGAVHGDFSGGHSGLTHGGGHVQRRGGWLADKR